MKLATIKNSITRVAGRAGLKVSKYSPEILLGIGVVSIVGGTIYACKSTLKVEEILDEHQETMDSINRAEGIEGMETSYTEQDAKKDRAILVIQTGWKLVKLYAPAAFLVGGGITCIMSSHGIMKKRNAALVSAYNALDQAFKDYRRRVIEATDEQFDEEMRTGAYETTLRDPETEEEKVLKVKSDGMSPSIYARYFDESSSQWCKNAEMNLMKVISIQNFANDKLKAQGHLFLNEVYDMLGFERTQAGAIVGWLARDGYDGYVDFGIHDIARSKARDFVNGLERVILLDFNVDGTIYDKI